MRRSAKAGGQGRNIIASPHVAMGNTTTEPRSLVSAAQPVGTSARAPNPITGALPPIPAPSEKPNETYCKQVSTYKTQMMNILSDYALQKISTADFINTLNTLKTSILVACENLNGDNCCS